MGHNGRISRRLRYSVRVKKFAVIFFVISMVFVAVMVMLTIIPTAGSATFKVQVSSSSCWSGFLGNSTVEGCGSKSVEVDSSTGIFAGSVQKQSDDGIPLTLKLEINGKIVDQATTSSAYGIAMVSGS